MSGSWHEQQIAEAEKVAATLKRPAKHCGDILDRLPRVECGASSLRDCPLTREQMMPTADLINRTAYLGDVLRREADARRKENQ